MNKINLALGLVSAGLAVTGLIFWQQIRAGRDLIDNQAARMAQMAKARVEIAPAPQDPPVTSAVAAPVIQSPAARPEDPRPRQRHPLLDPEYRAGAPERYRFFVREELRDLPVWLPLSEHAMEGLVRVISRHRVEMDTLLVSAGSTDQQEGLRQRQESEILQWLGYDVYSVW